MEPKKTISENKTKESKHLWRRNSGIVGFGYQELVKDGLRTTQNEKMIS